MGDHPGRPQGPFNGWIIGWLRENDQNTIGTFYWAWWTGKDWGKITDAKEFEWKADADAEALGLVLESDGEGEIRVQ